ncbi:succinoglycan biosynthesis transporter [Rhizobium grahamii]|uniref:Succinoglycan biosynthesis transport protein n=1 Tax=Rhizobium grahamii CCGE 502 TaxID=990285 RepID=S3I3M5_9HYPH|nr:succinoglycan biosynthesis transporter [Rhizobium grahamii]EPE99746.1 succinoglycan biosynthesis transport protein [Rhizobium grahamii CCGE 502]
MYDSNPRNQAFNRPTARPDRAAPPSKAAAALPAAEAQLLGVIERALERQQARQAATADAPPLVSRIETILGKRLEAANDVESEVVEPRPVLSESEVARPPANVNRSPSAVGARVSKTRRLQPLLMIGLMCAMGGASGTLIPAEPARYSAEGKLGMEGASQGRAEMVKAAEKTLLSSRTIAATVAALKLDHDSEFSGLSSDALAVAFDLIAADGAAADPVSRAEASLASAIQTATDPHAGTVDFKVTTGSVEKSARIAGYLASMMTSAGTANAVAEGGSLKKADDAAQLELSSFTQKSGEGNVKVATDLRQQIGSVDTELKAAEQRIVSAQDRVRRLKTAKVGDVLAGTLDADLMSPELVERRDKDVAAQLSLSQLSVNLGPRHPRLQAQQAEVDGARAAVGDELARLLREANDEIKSATTDKRQLSDRRNALIAQSKDTGVDLAKLTELRDKASAARDRLEDAITTGSVPGAVSMQLLKGVQVVAVPADQGWLPPLLGALAGLAFGFATVSVKARATLAAFPRKEPSLRTGAQEPATASSPLAAPVETSQDMAAIRADLAAMRQRLHTRSATS